MLRLTLSKKSEKLRKELRRWLAEHPVPSEGDSFDSFLVSSRAWQKALASGGWLGVSWDTKFGGRGLTLVEEAVVQEELVRANSPQILGLFGFTMVGPVLLKHGTEAQKERFLPKILSGDEIWCQGFSEPGAGSDLASVRSRAQIVDGGFSLSGQKVWTSFAQVADWCIVLARTEATSTRHQGLSFLLVKMKQPGITTRPLKQITGDAEFNEVFFDNVFIPNDCLIGAPGEGWSIAISTLMFERAILTFARQLQSERMIRTLLSDPQVHKNKDAVTSLAQIIAEGCAVRALSYEHLLEYGEGKNPGPEGSMDKLLWSESFQRATALKCNLSGKDIIWGEKGVAGDAVHQYLYSRGRTIAAGTSEIQRSIISERLLGLPRKR